MLNNMQAKCIHTLDLVKKMRQCTSADKYNLNVQGGCLFGSSQNWTIFRGHFSAFKGLFLRSRYRMGDIVLSIFFWGER